MDTQVLVFTVASNNHSMSMHDTHTRHTHPPHSHSPTQMLGGQAPQKKRKVNKGDVLCEGSVPASKEFCEAILSKIVRVHHTTHQSLYSPPFAHTHAHSQPLIREVPSTTSPSHPSPSFLLRFVAFDIHHNADSVISPPLTRSWETCVSLHPLVASHTRTPTLSRRIGTHTQVWCGCLVS